MLTKNKYPKLLVAILFCLSTTLSAEPLFADKAQADYKDHITQRQTVDLLINDALKAFKSPARISHAGFTGKLSSNMEIVAERLKKAYELEPYRADLLFSIASAYVYNKDITNAIIFYNKILEIAPEDSDAHTYLAAWYLYQGNLSASDKHMKILKDLNPGRAAQTKKLFSVINHVASMPLSDRVESADSAALTSGNTAIVTLGYALNPDGSMHDILIQRLEKTAEIAKQFPDALIILTGGVPQNNKTEGDLMRDWLIEKGIRPERLFPENFARSTVENALFSRYALAKHKIKQTILISSGSHVRRAQALFTIASWETGPRDNNYVAVAALDKPLAQLQKTSDGDLQGIYRDALKVFGLWSFRSYPLEER